MPLLRMDAWRPYLGAPLLLLRRSPGYALALVLLLALGSAAALLAAQLFRSVVLAPLPYAEEAQLVRVRESFPPAFIGFGIALGQVPHLTSATATVSGWGWFRQRQLSLESGEWPVPLSGMEVDTGFFPTLRPRFLLGDAGSGDAEGGQVVLSAPAWRRHFGADPAVVGRSVLLQGELRTITGVLVDQGDALAPGTEAFVIGDPTARDPGVPGVQRLGAIARLAPGVGIAAAQAQLTGLSGAAAMADGRQAWTPDLRPLREDIVSASRGHVMLFCAVVLLLCLTVLGNACALGVVHGTARLPAMGVRLALGATRGRLLRGLLGETCTLGLLGGALGGAIGLAGAGLLRPALAGRLPRIESLEFGAEGVAACVLLGGLLGLVVGASVATALRRRLGVSTAAALAAAPGSRGGLALRRTLVAAKLAIAFMLLSAAILLALHQHRLSREDPGIRLDGRHVVSLNLPSDRYGETAALRSFQRRLVEATAGLPGVEAASLAQSLPMLGGYGLTVEVEGQPTGELAERLSAQEYMVSQAHFPSLEIPLLAGRLLDAADREGAAPVAVVSAEFVARYLDHGPALGRRIRMANEREWREIVGVVGEVRQGAPGEAARPQVYTPIDQRPFQRLYLVLSSPLGASDLAGPLRRMLFELDPQLPLAAPRSLVGIRAAQLWPDRALASLAGSVALVAIGLGLLGLSASLRYAVDLERAHIGIRQALGAPPGSETMRVLRQSLGLAILGVLSGASALAVLWQALAPVIHGLPDLHAGVLTAVGLGLVLAAQAAALPPALRASRVAPGAALRAM